MPPNQWLAWAKEKLDAATFWDEVLLSFYNERQYAEFHKTYGRGKYRIVHTLTNHQTGRFHVWVVRQ